MFRRRALGWLRDDLAAYAKLSEQKNPFLKQEIRRRLTHSGSDPGLAPVCDSQVPARLPVIERAAWQALWRDVDELANRAAERFEPIEGREEAEKLQTRYLPPSRATNR